MLCMVVTCQVSLIYVIKVCSLIGFSILDIHSNRSALPKCRDMSTRTGAKSNVLLILIYFFQGVLIVLFIYFWFKYDLGEKYYMDPNFDPTRVQTHDLQIMTVHFMSLKRLL